jgi:hypothetical protein
MAGEPHITEAMIARRAFEISLVERDSSPEENWDRARRELLEETQHHGEDDER